MRNIGLCIVIQADLDTSKTFTVHFTSRPAIAPVQTSETNHQRAEGWCGVGLKNGQECSHMVEGNTTHKPPAAIANYV